MHPPGHAQPFDVYCDMTTDGGGFTLVDNDATNAATFTTRDAGANPDIGVTRGSFLPAHAWSSTPQLLVKSSCKPCPMLGRLLPRTLSSSLLSQCIWI